MRLARFFITSSFFFFFAFGIHSQVLAQSGARYPQKCSLQKPTEICIPIDTDGIDCMCQRKTQGNVPLEKQDQDKANAATYATNQTSLQSTVWNQPAIVNNKVEYKGSIMGSVLAGLLSSITQSSNLSTSSQVYVKPNGESVTVTFGSGAIGTITNLTAQMIGKPQISSTEYVADLLRSIQNPLGAQPAFAQGLGFSSLAPTLSLWKVFRNIAYFFFVVIFLVIGFMIMFRSKIGGQAAVTIQQALPKIVVSLLLVTFSYAIAGLMIDVMYLVIYMIIGIFSPFFSSGIAGGSMFGGESLTKIAFQNNIIQNMLSLITNGAVGNVAGALGNITVGALGLTEKDLGGAAVQGIANITLTLILAIVVLVSIFRVFLVLLQAYIFIFFSVIFAPLQLLIGAVPGQNTFGKWLRSLLENLLVFPTIILMIFIAYFFTGPQGVQNTNTSGTNLGFSAPQLTSNQGADGFAVYQSLIALGVILAMPEVLKVTKGLMKGEVGVGMGDLVNNFKQGVPLGSRLAIGGGLGLAQGALSFGSTYLRERRTNPQAFKAARQAFYGDANKGTGFAGGMGRGAKLSSTLSTALTANQPDILNPFTQGLDKKFSPETARKEDTRQQNEDIIDLLKQINAKP